MRTFATLRRRFLRQVSYWPRVLYPYVILSSVGEVLLILWLSVKGVDEQRWREQASAAAAK